MTDPSQDPHKSDPAHSLELTRSALREGLPELGLEGGLVEVQRWIEILGDGGAPEVAEALTELRGLLEGAADGDAFRPVLERLASLTRGAAEGVSDARVASELRDLANELEQAPATLTGL